METGWMDGWIFTAMDVDTLVTVVITALLNNFRLWAYYVMHWLMVLFVVMRTFFVIKLVHCILFPFSFSADEEEIERWEKQEKKYAL